MRERNSTSFSRKARALDDYTDRNNNKNTLDRYACYDAALEFRNFALALYKLGERSYTYIIKHN